MVKCTKKEGYANTQYTIEEGESLQDIENKFINSHGGAGFIVDEQFIIPDHGSNSACQQFIRYSAKII